MQLVIRRSPPLNYSAILTILLAGTQRSPHIRKCGNEKVALIRNDPEYNYHKFECQIVAVVKMNAM